MNTLIKNHDASRDEIVVAVRATIVDAARAGDIRHDALSELLKKLEVAVEKHFDYCPEEADDENEWMDYDDRDATGQDSCNGSTSAPDMLTAEY
jgi:hypothetical protein